MSDIFRITHHKNVYSLCNLQYMNKNVPIAQNSNISLCGHLNLYVLDLN